jgi:ElaB/YqjD/DUF883 family membrane-anchored ribosome-binding protein
MELVMSEVPIDDARPHVDTPTSDTVSYSVEDAIQGFGEAAHATAEAFRAAGRAAGRSASSFVSGVGVAVPGARDQFARGIQLRPLTAIMVSAAVGLLAGVALARR